MRGAISKGRVSNSLRPHCEFHRFQVELDGGVVSARRKISTLSIPDAVEVVTSCSTRRKAGFNAVEARALRDFQARKFKRTIDGFQQMAFELLLSGNRRKRVALDVSTKLANSLLEGKSVNSVARRVNAISGLNAKQVSTLRSLLREFEFVLSVQRETLAFALRACESVVGRVSPKQNVFLENFSRSLNAVFNASVKNARQAVNASAQAAGQVVDLSARGAQSVLGASAEAARSVVDAGMQAVDNVLGAGASAAVHVADGVSPLSVQNAARILDASLQSRKSFFKRADELAGKAFEVACFPFKLFFKGVKLCASGVLAALRFTFLSMHAPTLIVFAFASLLPALVSISLPKDPYLSLMRNLTASDSSSVDAPRNKLFHSNVAYAAVEHAPAAVQPSNSFSDFVFEKKEGKKRVPEVARDGLKDYGAAFLVMGTDTREGDAVGRSDSLHLIVFHEADNRIYIASLSRDLLVDIPGYGRQKINHASFLGGPELEVEAVENFLGVQIDGYFECSVARFAKAYDKMRSLFKSSNTGSSSEQLLDAGEFGARDGKEFARALQLRSHPGSVVPTHFKNIPKNASQRVNNHAELLERVLKKGVGFHKAHSAVAGFGLRQLLDPLFGSAAVNSDFEAGSLLRFAELVERRFPYGPTVERLFVSGKGGRDHSLHYYDGMRRVWSDGVWVETPEQLPEGFEGTRFDFGLSKHGGKVVQAKPSAPPPT